MLAIGIDPGTAICGFGLVEMVGNKLTPIHYGAVFTDKDMLPELRLKKIYDELSVLLDEYRPDVMSVEQLFFNRNVTTAISVGQARGVALLTAANRGIQITEFTPMQIKQAVAGRKQGLLCLQGLHGSHLAEFVLGFNEAEQFLVALVGHTLGFRGDGVRNSMAGWRRAPCVEC